MKSIMNTKRDKNKRRFQIVFLMLLLFSPVSNVWAVTDATSELAALWKLIKNGAESLATLKDQVKHLEAQKKQLETLVNNYKVGKLHKDPHAIVNWMNQQENFLENVYDRSSWLVGHSIAIREHTEKLYDSGLGFDEYIRLRNESKQLHDARIREMSNKLSLLFSSERIKNRKARIERVKHYQKTLQDEKATPNERREATRLMNGETAAMSGEMLDTLRSISATLIETEMLSSQEQHYKENQALDDRMRFIGIRTDKVDE